MIHLVSERAENDITLYLSNSENESSRQWFGRNLRFEETMNHSLETLELDFNWEYNLVILGIDIVRKLEKSLDDSKFRMENANRTCNLILGVGDGKNEIFNSVRYSHSGKLPIFPMISGFLRIVHR